MAQDLISILLQEETRDSSEASVFSPRGKLPQAREWAAAHVHARAEKALARLLHSWDVPLYLPLLRRCRSYGARKRESFVPLFAVDQRSKVWL